MARHRGRQQALQLLFQWDLRRMPIEDIIAGYYSSLLVSEETIGRPRPDQFAEHLLRGVVQDLPGVDDLISRHAAHWRLDRMPTVDRNILRLAVYEMLPDRYSAGGRNRRGARTGAAVFGRGIGPLRQRRSGRRAPRTPPRYCCTVIETPVWV